MRDLDGTVKGSHAQNAACAGPCQFGRATRWVLSSGAEGEEPVRSEVEEVTDRKGRS